MANLAAPSGSYFRIMNPDTGVITLVPAPAGLQLEPGSTVSFLDPGSSDAGVPVRPSTGTTVAAAATPGTTALPSTGTTVAYAATGTPGSTALPSTGTTVASAATGTPGSTALPSSNPSTAPDIVLGTVDGHIVTRAAPPVATPVIPSTAPTTAAVVATIDPKDMSCYAPEGGEVSQLHLDAALNPGILVGMQRYNASSDTAEVCRLVFHSTTVTAKMDTRETVTFQAGIAALEEFLKAGKAAQSLVLVFSTQRHDAINASRKLWTTFTSKTDFMAISGTLHIEELDRLLPALQHIDTLNICHQKFIRGGCLSKIASSIPPNVTQFLFDTRETSNTTLIDNVMALYGPLYMRKYQYQPCFNKLILIVTDFCKSKALEVQLQRLADMLFDDASSAAAIITMTPGDDTILKMLFRCGFNRGRGAYFTNIDRAFQKFDYWRTTINGKTVVLGFRDRVDAVAEKDSLVF